MTRKETETAFVSLSDEHAEEILNALMTCDESITAAFKQAKEKIKDIAIESGMEPEQAIEFAGQLAKWEVDE